MSNATVENEDTMMEQLVASLSISLGINKVSIYLSIYLLWGNQSEGKTKCSPYYKKHLRWKEPQSFVYNYSARMSLCFKKEGVVRH